MNLVPGVRPRRAWLTEAKLGKDDRWLMPAAIIKAAKARNLKIAAAERVRAVETLDLPRDC
jgi:hypothetical protein